MKRLSRKKTGLIGAGLLFLTAGLIWQWKRPEGRRSDLGAVARGSLIQRVTISGNVVPNRKTVISAPYNGYVRKLYVQIGDRVKAGDPIVSIAQSLRGEDTDVFPLRAPFSGTVVQVLRTEGEYVEQAGGADGSNSLVRIDDLSRLFVEAASPEIEMNKIKLGQNVLVRASAVTTRPFHGKVERIALAAREPKSGDRARAEFPISLSISDGDSSLMPGMSVIVDIVTHEQEGLLMLRHEFVQRDGDGKYFVISPSGVKKVIEVGIQNEEVVEIRAGLQEGEQVRMADFLPGNSRS